jgi:ribosomal protein S18 acetylase RimI-like enzyme
MAQGKSRPLAELSPEDVVRACEENYIEYWRCVGSSANARYSEDEGVVMCATGLPQDMFNVVMRCTLDRGTVEHRVDEVLRYFRARGLPGIWHIGPSTEPQDIGDHLTARGLPHDYDLSAMAVELGPIDWSWTNSSRVQVRRVSTKRDCADWVDCLTSSWESPKEVGPWMLDNACFNLSHEAMGKKHLHRRKYLGFLGGKPAGTSMLVWDRDIAGLQTIGTIKEAQRNGVGTVVILAALKDAKDMGFKFVVVLSTTEGLKLYRNLGFKEYGKLPEHGIHFEPK